MRILTARLELVPGTAGNTALLLLGHLKLRISNQLKFTKTKEGTTILFELPPGVDTIKLAEAMERLDPELRAIVQRINLFEDVEEDGLQQAAQHG